MHRRVRGVVGSGMASVASMAQHGPVGDQGTPVSSQHESMQRHRSDDMGLKDARASESDKADCPMKEAPCGASHSTPSGETIGTGTGKQPEQILRLKQHPRAKAALCLAAQRGNCWLQRYAATRFKRNSPPCAIQSRHRAASEVLELHIAKRCRECHFGGDFTWGGSQSVEVAQKATLRAVRLASGRHA